MMKEEVIKVHESIREVYFEGNSGLKRMQMQIQELQTTVKSVKKAEELEASFSI
jgi:hypothetical protein